MDDTAGSEPWQTNETDSAMKEAIQRITELDAERDLFVDRWLKAEAECAELRRQLHELKSANERRALRDNEQA